MKKHMLMITALLCAALMLCGMVLFVFSGEEAQTLQTPALEGTWKVAAKGKASVLSEDEYIVFEGDTAVNYRSGSPYASSAYTLKDAKDGNHFKLTLGDLNRGYTLLALTENYIRLYESKDVYMDLVRYADAQMRPLPIEQGLEAGAWDVAYRATDKQGLREQLVFEAGKLYVYRNGAQETAMTAAYTMDADGLLLVPELGKQMQCVPLTDDVLFLVETDTGMIWELHRTQTEGGAG